MTYDYDYLVIGGGSGGVSSAKRAAQLYGKRVAVIESSRWGGTCVNVGCVPKKIMYQAAHIREMLLTDAKMYTFNMGDDDYKMDWPRFKDKRDKYVARLSGIYRSGLQNAGITIYEGFGNFLDDHTVHIKKADGTTENVTAEYILIATGGKPFIDTSVEGVEHSITSDGFFELAEQPKKAVVVGAGYIAVELAGVLSSLGTETHLVVRKGKALRNFDPEISDFLDKQMQHDGITIHRNTNGLAKIELTDGNKKTVTTVSGKVIEDVDVVLMAPGRVPNVEELELENSMKPNVEGLGLEHAGVKQHEKDQTIIADDLQQTTVPHIMAIGDVCGKVELTPMAIAAGRRLSDRLFGEKVEPVPKTSYENVPTVVFSHPTIGTIGLTEPEAIEKYGQDNVKVYKSTFVNLHYAMFDMEPSEKPTTLVKLITAGIHEQVVGLHMIGMAVDEVLQGFGVAMKMGATKADFDSVGAIHPTAAEEVVTLGTWGTSPLASGAKVSPLMGAAAPEPQLKSKM
ncbi:hypothetical protein ACA910_013605 [Epithemia clementina (nom. ined.)]